MNECICHECKIRKHDSDCAVHNEPATPKGDCDCKDGWISLGDHFPAFSDFRPSDPTLPRRVVNEILVATKEGRVFTTTYTRLGFANLNSRTDEVTHWQPLPPLPTK